MAMTPLPPAVAWNMTDDREHNRRCMPETAELIACARRELSAFGPLHLVYAQEGDYEIGTAQDEIAAGHIDLSGVAVRVIKIRPRQIGGRAVRSDLDISTKSR